MPEVIGTTLNVRLYGLFRKQLSLSEESAIEASLELTAVINEKSTAMKEEAIKAFQNDQDNFRKEMHNELGIIRKDIQDFKIEVQKEFISIRKEFSDFRTEVQKGFDNFKLYVDTRFETMATKEELANTRVELIRWMFAFWVAQLGAMVGIIMIFFRK